ncbi:sex-regulated protein janus-a [Lasius niger]|uniref:Sex-regulated protein janus-a n=1 Tax=Lasius niger TaxID=67767 RepID=A0A0J7KYN7_LASNI|nr:sex-regulated protein janus-a [Lasius niger]
MEQEQIFYKQQEKDICKNKKKEEIKKPDCSEIKKIKPCEKKECPTVEKAPESTLSYGDRPGNDDYFPQGEEYEDEIGTDDHQLGGRNTLSKESQSNNEYDNFDSTMLMFENNKSVNRGPLTRFVTYIHSLSTESTVSGKELRLGESDCGEDLPSQPKRNPCDPPKGPCQPAQPPGYPSKPKPKRKPFCVKCPSKKPCKDEKC